MAFQPYSITLDSAMQLKDAGNVAASAAGTVGGSAAVIDLGATNNYTRFAVVIDIAAVLATTGNYVTLFIQGSDTSAFSTTYTLTYRSVGDTASISQPVDTAVGSRIVLFADNVACTSATDPASLIACRYVRIYAAVGGSGTCNYQAWMVPIQG